MSDPYVLIVSTIADVATDEVVRRLTSIGIPHKRLNTENFPFSSTLTFRPDKGSKQDWMAIDAKSVHIPSSVWYRRVRTPSKPEGMDDGIYTFCLHENRAAFLGSLLGLNGRWMSYPAAVWRAEFKPFQLSLAHALGIPIPPTVITNDPSMVRRAYAEFGQLIVKPTRSGHVVHGAQDFAIFTSRVLEEHLDQVDSARWSPAIYQTLIPKRFDIRITIVGRKVFAAAIDSQSDPAAAIDWRQTENPKLPHHAIDLPQDLCQRLLRLMDSLQLTFGAIDMIQTTEGDYVFLEVNPSGQWLWLDDMLDLGISNAIAEWLAKTEVQ